MKPLGNTKGNYRKVHYKRLTVSLLFNAIPTPLFKFNFFKDLVFLLHVTPLIHSRKGTYVHTLFLILTFTYV